MPSSIIPDELEALIDRATTALGISFHQIYREGYWNGYDAGVEAALTGPDEDEEESVSPTSFPVFSGTPEKNGYIPGCFCSSCAEKFSVGFGPRVQMFDPVIQPIPDPLKEEELDIARWEEEGGNVESDDLDEWADDEYEDDEYEDDESCGCGLCAQANDRKRVEGVMRDTVHETLDVIAAKREIEQKNTPDPTHIRQCMNCGKVFEKGTPFYCFRGPNVEDHFDVCSRFCATKVL